MHHIEYACTLVDWDLRHALEFGVGSGRTINMIRGCLPGADIFGFDSFEGLPEDWRDAAGNIVGGQAKGAFSTGGVIPNITGVRFFKGLFEDTIQEYLGIGERIALLHIDCDLYSSTQVVLRELNDLIVPGTIILFDEWCYLNDPRNNDHEQRAFNEWAFHNGRRNLSSSGSPCPRSV